MDNLANPITPMSRYTVSSSQEDLLYNDLTQRVFFSASEHFSHETLTDTEGDDLGPVSQLRAISNCVARATVGVVSGESLDDAINGSVDYSHVDFNEHELDWMRREIRLSLRLFRGSWDNVR